MIYGIIMITMLKKISTLLSTFKAENQVWNKHAEAQLKKGRAYKKKMCITEVPEIEGVVGHKQGHNPYRLN